MPSDDSSREPQGADPSAATEVWDREARLFEELLEASAASRPALLNELCDGDDDLRSRLARLLSAHDDAGRFLDGLDTTAAAALVRAAASEAMPADFRQYRFVREIGRGGMGVVYLARDESLQRDVAIKFLPEHLCRDAQARDRFMREARAVSGIDDPNIVTVYEIDEVPDGTGRLYIAMQYYPGRTLREHIAEGPIETPVALEYARQIAQGLSSAHEEGLVHRDVKPGNILITDKGVAKLLDFGIAKGGGTNLTREATTVGTIAYMSPEQTGLGSVDHRTDIWSLGVVLHEMITGSRPFSGDADETLIYSIRNDDPTAAGGYAPAISKIVGRCLKKSPDSRYPTAQALAQELVAARSGRTDGSGRGWLVAAAVLILAAAAWLVPRLLDGSATSTPEPQRTRLAVLPLKDIGEETAYGHLGGTLTEELRYHLGREPQLSLVAQTSVTPLIEAQQSVAEIGQALDVDLVLEGTVRSLVDRVVVTLTLIDAATEERIWSDRYDEGVSGILSLETEIASQAASAIRRHTGVDEAAHISAGTDSDEAFGLYLRGRHLIAQLAEENLWQAVDVFNEALDIDPRFARAWSGLADAYTLIGSQGYLPPSEAHPLARAAAERALEYDPDLAEAHNSLAGPLADYFWEWDLAEHHFKRAIALNPNLADAYQWYAEMLSHVGRHEEALAMVQKAVSLDPLSPRRKTKLADLLHYSGRTDEAIAVIEQVMQTYPQHHFGKHVAAILHLAAGEADRAVDYFEKLHAIWGDYPPLVGLMSHAYARAGRTDEAWRELAKYDSLTAVRPFSEFYRVVAHIGLEEYDRAVTALESGYEDRLWLMTIINVEPMFDPLRGMPRFEALVDRIGLR